MKYDLSILIPARNEMFLSRTIDDILENIEGNTEIIVGLDGEWADPVIKDNKRVRIVYYPESIGQRALTNQLARLSKAKYVMKVDAHCAFDKGFDVKLMADMKDDWTVVPIMRNLHAFDWVCPDGHRRYQGPSGVCNECKKPTERDVVWIAKTSPQSKSYCFDPEPHFQYFSEFNKRPEGRGDLTETMSLQGSCFMMTRDKYWQLGICDEGFGSWGSQGIEVACKTWLSGGRVLVNHKTWYAHMFRTQGGDFSFPYEQKQSKVNEAKAKARELFFGNKWPLAKKPLSWLVEKFWPVYKWTKEDLDELKRTEGTPTKGIIFYTDNQLNLKIAHKVQRQLRSIGLPIVSTSLKPMSFGENYVIQGERGYETYFKQIILALEKSKADIVFFCEHDVLYHKSHFDFIPKEKDVFYYNLNVWRWKYPTDLMVTWEAEQVAELCCYRELALQWYKDKLKEFQEGKFNRSFEPKDKFETRLSEYPNIDIRHDGNLTKSKWSINDFRDKSTCINWKESTKDEINGWYKML